MHNIILPSLFFINTTGTSHGDILCLVKYFLNNSYNYFFNSANSKGAILYDAFEMDVSQAQAQSWNLIYDWEIIHGDPLKTHPHTYYQNLIYTKSTSSLYRLPNHENRSVPLIWYVPCKLLIYTSSLSLPLWALNITGQSLFWPIINSLYWQSIWTLC